MPLNDIASASAAEENQLTPSDSGPKMTNLPAELRAEIYRHADPETRLALAASSGLFAKGPERTDDLAQRLLACIASGNIKRACELLKSRPDLLTHRVSFDDTFTGCQFGEAFRPTTPDADPTLNARRLEPISVYEYLLYMLDCGEHVLNDVKSCIPDNEQGRAIKMEMSRQAIHLRDNGRTHVKEIEETITRDDGSTERVRKKVLTHAFHFDINTLLNALRNYIAAYDAWENAGFPGEGGGAVIEAWRLVGVAQRYTPTHVAQHYCDPDTPFYPTPSFKGAFNRQNPIKFYNFLQGAFQIWQGNLTVGLGGDFGLCRAGAAVAAPGLGWGPGGVVVAGLDLDSLIQLFQVRTLQFGLELSWAAALTASDPDAQPQPPLLSTL